MPGAPVGEWERADVLPTLIADAARVSELVFNPIHPHVGGEPRRGGDCGRRISSCVSIEGVSNEVMRVADGPDSRRRLPAGRRRPPLASVA